MSHFSGMSRHGQLDGGAISQISNRRRLERLGGGRDGGLNASKVYGVWCGDVAPASDAGAGDAFDCDVAKEQGAGGQGRRTR